ncbi:hypothetical protein [Alteraurantiacibacter aestuarii]|uniref:Uncharacterized protein n=1 Tax=Alteraurantiacibacter aestuarii TaxID=650004 RepID=A0A844ZI84_9SPHN|nr:hypothetical protein [Alteraurantiacibacter aestuarii]MXO87515.1 hypothetical protein [Alteraurantiacibacter aestuarii]
MSNNIPTPDEARAVLASTDDTRRKLAAAGHNPPVRHLVFGLILAFHNALPLMNWLNPLLALLLFGLAIYAIYRWDLKSYGVFVNGLRRGATLPVTILGILGLMGLFSAQLALKANGADSWIHYSLVAAAFAFGTGFSVLWSRAFRREMGDDS